MSRFWSEIVKKIEPYVPGEQPRDKKYIKLNTNENPYPPSPKVIEAIKNAANGDLRLYPDPSCDGLRTAIADYYNIKKDQVFAGNGSDELLAFCFMAFFDPGRAILFPDITYSFYPVYAELFNIDYDKITVDEDFSVPVESFLRENGGIVIPNPNAPTAKYLDMDSIKRILEHNRDSVVVLDEAYIDFGGESAVSLIDEYSNLLVIQTFSKSRSLAGLRIGFALGNAELIEALDRIKNSFNSYTLDRIALIAAGEAINDREYFEETRKRIIDTRERVSTKLRNMGFRVIDSKANFIFISHKHFRGEDLFQQLRNRGILVRHFKKPRIENFLRVSIGTDNEMDSFIGSIEDILTK